MIPGSGNTSVVIAMAVYLLIIIAVGVLFARKANESSDNFFLGGRGLGPWVAAMSAEASDMSGWLLMGLPGVAFLIGTSEAFWTAFGLLVGTWLNWLIVSKRLRKYSGITNSITLPEFFSNRFKEKKAQPILCVASLMILVFFAVYVGSCFAAGGKLFEQVFGAPYVPVLLVGAVIVVLYTLLGGFLAESVSDFIQGIVMIIALVALLTAGIIEAGGFKPAVDEVRDIPGFLSLTESATPEFGDDGVQIIDAEGAPVFSEETGSYGFLTIISTLSWGLGYFGMPQVLLRFFAIRKARELTRSRRIATVWCAISLFGGGGYRLAGPRTYRLGRAAYSERQRGTRIYAARGDAL